MAQGHSGRFARSTPIVIPFPGMDPSEAPRVQRAKAGSVFFDLDGTVTDPREGIVRSISHALTAMKHPSPSDESLARFIGPPLAKTFESLLGTTD